MIWNKQTCTVVLLNRISPLCISYFNLSKFDPVLVISILKESIQIHLRYMISNTRLLTRFTLLK